MEGLWFKIEVRSCQVPVTKCYSCHGFPSQGWYIHIIHKHVLLSSCETFRVLMTSESSRVSLMCCLCVAYFLSVVSLLSAHYDSDPGVVFIAQIAKFHLLPILQTSILISHPNLSLLASFELDNLILLLLFECSNVFLMAVSLIKYIDITFAGSGYHCTTYNIMDNMDKVKQYSM